MNPTNAPRISASLRLLRGLKNLKSSIHSPLPLTPRESNKLLRAVQYSFRQHLESEPSVASTNDSRAPYTSPNAHLENVLKMMPFLPSAEEARAQREERIKRFLVDPISVFEEHVSLGTATIDLAKSCLARCNDLKTGGSRSEGSRVLMGLVNAGLLERPERFLDDVTLSYQVIVALVHEGKEDLIVKWILKGDTSRPRKFIQHIEKHIGLEKATQIFFAFYEQLQNSHNTELMVPVLGLIGRQLCMAAKATGRLPAAQLDRLLLTSGYWARSRAEHAMIQLRFGNNVLPGLQFLAAIDAKPEQWWAELPVARRKKLAQLGIELTRECLAQERLDNALKAAKVVSRRFVEQLGRTPGPAVKDSTSQSIDEAVEHLDVFREMFNGALRKKLEASLG